MRLLEFQAKELFREYGINLLDSKSSTNIEEGREHLNFSEWGKYTERRKKHKLEECWEEVEENKMPLNSYLWVHGEAKLSEEQASLLIDWFKEQENAF